MPQAYMNSLRDKSKSIERTQAESGSLIGRARQAQQNFSTLNMSEKERHETEMYHKMKNMRVAYRVRKAEIEHIQKMKKVKRSG